MKVVREIFVSSEAKARLEANRLADFDALWQLDDDWIEDPNSRGSGFSGVVTRVLGDGEGAARRVYIKRQENHNTRTFAHPIRGIPTFQREFANIEALSRHGVPTIELLYFGMAEVKGKQRAILVSDALDEFTAVDEWFRHSRNQASEADVHAILRALVAAIKLIHQAGYRHGCLYGKHLFIRVPRRDCQTADVEVRMLDFEKAHKCYFLRRAILRDLSQFVRHCDGLTDEDLDYLLDQYQGQADRSGMKRLLQMQIDKKSR